MASATYDKMSRKSQFRGSLEPHSGQMQGLLSEFRGLYESKLRRLDEAERAGEDIDRVKDISFYLFVLLCLKMLMDVCTDNQYFQKFWQVETWIGAKFKILDDFSNAMDTDKLKHRGPGLIYSNDTKSLFTWCKQDWWYEEQGDHQLHVESLTLPET